MLNSTSVILSHLLGAIEATPVDTRPFPHIEVCPFFPEDVFSKLASTLPAVRQYRGFRLLRDDDGRLTRYKFDLLNEYIFGLPRRQRAIWRDVSNALRARALADLFKAKFCTTLEARFDCAVERLRLLPVPSLMRDFGGLYYPAHTDTMSKAITCQCYLPRDQAGQGLGTHFHEADENGAPGGSAKIIPFQPNQGYAFPVHDRSYHSLPRLTDLAGPRDSLLLIFYNVTQPRRAVFYAGKRVSSFLGHKFHIRKGRPASRSRVIRPSRGSG